MTGCLVLVCYVLCDFYEQVGRSTQKINDKQYTNYRNVFYIECHWIFIN